MELFDEVAAHAEEVLKDELWYEMKSLSFGPQSPTPLKILVASKRADWSRGWTLGCQSYRKDLSVKAQKKFDQNSGNPLTIDSDALPIANRKAITQSNCLLVVGCVGPVLESLDAPLSESLRTRFHISGETLPVHIQALYVRREDGKYHIPRNTMPPKEWIATETQVFKLLKYNDFVNEVGAAHAQLVDEGPDKEEVLENLRSGSASPAPGTT